MCPGFSHKSNQEFKISRLMLVNLDRICEIELLAHGQTGWKRQAFIDELNNPCSNYWILEKRPENNILGFIGFHHIDKEGFITNLALDPEFQGQGYSKLLIEYLIGRSKDWKIDYLTLEVRKSNIKAKNLYKKYGFKEISTRKNYYPPIDELSEREDGIIMTLELVNFLQNISSIS